MISDGREQCRPSASSSVSTCHSRPSAPRLDLHGSELMRKGSKVARARMPTVDIYPGPVLRAIETPHNTHTPAEKCLATHPTPCEVCGTFRRGAHFAGHTGGHKSAPELIPSHSWQRAHSTRRSWAAWVTSVRSRATVRARSRRKIGDVLGVKCLLQPGMTRPLPPR